ncbi:SDR family NAD(P)-dependent oxidoreductase [Microbacterium allomyrinae]|uniref:SDR family oxidoreductase n=1 Tax=Microbacterium allomyrinae TaxID=2830666 RepID=A0A9X1S2F1_9MICO|nr:SDR family oxidoreductase [Microbacterium allomyrinae]MCC2032636.1 SDR family oxidoreductase [Microbacterium allomyrinae]
MTIVPSAPGRVILTGSSSGIGLALAEMFLGHGWTVFGLDLNASPESTASSPAFQGFEVDVTDDAAVGEVFDRISADGAAPDALVTAAGMYPTTFFGSSDLAAFRRLFDLNVWGTVTACQHFARICAPGASIVTISSRDAYIPQENQFLYGASKAAVAHLTAAMATSLLPRGIRVNSVSPPRVATEALRAIYGEMPADAVPLSVITSAVHALAVRGEMAGLNGQIVRIPALGEVAC